MDVQVTFALARDEMGAAQIFMQALEQMREVRAKGYTGRFEMNVSLNAVDLAPPPVADPATEPETKPRLTLVKDEPAPDVTEPEPETKPRLTLVKDEPAPDVTEPEPEVDVAPPTEQQVIEAVRAYIARAGFPAAQALLGSFGVKRVPEIPVERRAEFIGRTVESSK